MSILEHNIVKSITKDKSILEKSKNTRHYDFSSGEENFNEFEDINSRRNFLSNMERISKRKSTKKRYEDILAELSEDTEERKEEEDQSPKQIEEIERKRSPSNIRKSVLFGIRRRGQVVEKRKRKTSRDRIKPKGLVIFPDDKFRFIWDIVILL